VEEGKMVNWRGNREHKRGHSSGGVEAAVWEKKFEVEEQWTEKKALLGEVAKICKRRYKIEGVMHVHWEIEAKVSAFCF